MRFQPQVYQNQVDVTVCASAANSLRRVDRSNLVATIALFFQQFSCAFSVVVHVVLSVGCTSSAPLALP